MSASTKGPHRFNPNSREGDAVRIFIAFGVNKTVVLRDQQVFIRRQIRMPATNFQCFLALSDACSVWFYD